MKIYPAIDLYEGKVVRLTRGDFKQETIYSQHPEEMAKEWETQGAKWIHVVDLEGAKTGILKNRESLLRIRKAVKCSIQFGGGLRSYEIVREILEAGIDRVVIGTKALDATFLDKLLSSYKDRIAIGLDIRDGKVQTEGWLKESAQSLSAAVDFLNRYPIGMMIYTDISKDGMLQGPNFVGLSQVLNQAKSRIILSGGVGTLDDIRQAVSLNHPRLEGVIVGKALYEKKFALKDAVALTK